MREKELAPCGVFCGACPSFGKSCLGCSSEVQKQKRTSKWSCPIRKCCYENKGISYCIDCNDFPCHITDKKLFVKHKNDNRFDYRYEIPHIFPMLRTMGIEDYLDFQINRWKCECSGTIRFYSYECDRCGAAKQVR